VRDVELKALLPRDSQARGTVFADPRGLEILRGTWIGARRLILGEGLTDFLALSTVSPAPVLSAPGTSMAPSAFGPWVKDFDVMLALDWDAAGDAAIHVAAKSAYGHGAARVRRLEWPDSCKDACDVVARVGLEGLGDFLSRFLGTVG
jgi:DNA primase